MCGMDMAPIVLRGDIIREWGINELDVRQPVKVMASPAFEAFKYVK